MTFSENERARVFLVELQALQDRFATYDDMVWRSRSWAIALVTAFIGWGLTATEDPTASRSLLYGAVLVATLFWLLESLLRFFHVYKYVIRYRRIRSTLNEEGGTFGTIPLYDLSNHIEGRGKLSSRFAYTLLRPEPLLFYVILALTPVLVDCLVG